MLVQLTIRDFAIIDHLSISWVAGLNILTGETGAGKSIIVDALGALLGDRLGPEHIRTGAERAMIEAVFEVDFDKPGLIELRADLEERALLEDGGTIILARETARSSGRSIARINGRAVPQAVLSEVAAQLVDIHSQSQHLSLLRPREHLGLLDRFAGLVEQRSELAASVSELHRVERELRQLESEERQMRREEALLRHEVAEIEAIDPSVEEEQELLRQRSRLRNVERLRAAASTAYEALSGGDEGRSAAELIRLAVSAGAEIQRLDPAAADHFAGLDEAAAVVEDCARSLARYLDEIEADPALLEATEERLLAYAALKRKYGETVQEVRDYLTRARARLERLEHREQDVAELTQQRERLRHHVSTAALELSRRRQEAGQALARAVEQELAALRMAGATFRVAFHQQADPAGVPVPDARGEVNLVACDTSGIDRVEFLLSANPGEAPKPLQRIASGGELARVALALKAVLSQADRRPTLVFDEVDVGVGGRTAVVVGQKLWSLSRHHQVLCITHLPQVAAFADQHLVVSKQVVNGQTTITVQPVERETRLDELAAMLSGSASSEAARENARELLRRSREAKVSG